MQMFCKLAVPLLKIGQVFFFKGYKKELLFADM